MHRDPGGGQATSPRVSSELEQARPQTSGEEELQLQLALAMSREVAEQKQGFTMLARLVSNIRPRVICPPRPPKEERLRRGDDLRLQMALEESRRDTVKIPKKKEHGSLPQQTTLLDLMDALPSSGPAAQKAEPWGPSASTNQTNPWGGPAAPASTSDPWPSFEGGAILAPGLGTADEMLLGWNKMTVGGRSLSPPRICPLRPVGLSWALRWRLTCGKGL
ncbi:Epsin-2, partial [Plecturocebus cupreus]